METPDIINGSVDKLYTKEEFTSTCEKLWKETRFVMELYGKDTQGSIIEIGDLIGKFDNGDVTPYVVCCSSDKSFYLADYRAYNAINDGIISSVADLRNKASARIGKINSNKKVVKIPYNVVPLLVRDKYGELQRKVFEIHEKERI